MQYKSVKGFTGWSQLGFLFVFLGLGFIIASGISILMIHKMLPGGQSFSAPDAVMKAMTDPENVNMARMLNLLSTLATLFIPALLWSFISNGKNFFWLGFNKYLGWRQILLGMLIIFTAGIAAEPLADLSKYIVSHFPSLDSFAKEQEDTYNQLALAMSHLSGWGDYIIAIFVMCFFPALFEEVFFRGCLQNLLTKWWKKPMAAIIFSAVIFSLVHASVYLFLSRFILGMALGIMFYETKNILINITAHFLNNLIVLSTMFFMKDESAAKKIESADPHVPWTFGVLAAGVLFGMFMFLRRYSQRNKARIQAKENLLIAAADPFRSFTQENAADGA